MSVLNISWGNPVLFLACSFSISVLALSSHSMMEFDDWAMLSKLAFFKDIYQDSCCLIPRWPPDRRWAPQNSPQYMRNLLGNPGKMESSWEGTIQQRFQHSGEAFSESGFIRECHRQDFSVSLMVLSSSTLSKMPFICLYVLLIAWPRF